MKHSIKLVPLYLFALLFTACLPHEKMAGRVIDLTGPVPDAALLGMVWIEDAAKAKPTPEVKGLEGKALDDIYEKDMKERGLPVAYTRSFADANGWFALDKLHFSAETKKAVSAMKQPVVSRVTVWAFRKGYLKRAVTAFPKPGEELPYATLLLPKPADWKELYRENTIDSLTANYMVRGYSKAFGATKAEKSWMLEYAHSNLWQAYTESDIKGDKKYEELCGHDYSDIIVSSTSMQRNPAHEKCAELLKRMADLRDVEGLWIAHSKTNDDAVGSEKELVKTALAALPAELTEPKAYESAILAGIGFAIQEKSSGQINLRNEATGNMDVAQKIYGKGGKAEAYQMLGRTLYGKFLNGSEDMQIAELETRVVPGIRENIAVFYQLMNRPLTAQVISSGSSTRTDATISTADVSTETVEVNDYKSFLEYNKKQVGIPDSSIGEIKLKKNEISFSDKITRHFLKNSTGENDEVGFLSGDKNYAGVFNLRDRSLRIFNNSGNETRKITLSKFPKGVEFVLANNRIYAISPSFDGPGGFEIFKSTGGYIKWVNIGDVTGYAVSNTSKYFFITAGKQITGDYFFVYDMHDNELWRLRIAAVEETRIFASPDDRFVAIMVPKYWVKAKETDKYETVKKTNKLYVLDILNHKVVSEEDYAY